MINEEKFFQYCSDINIAVWENRISKKDIEDWIGNFKPQEKIDVRKMAIDLLLGLIYYNESEIRYLCNHAFSEFKRQKIKEYLKNGFKIKDAENSFTQSISKINFIGKNGDSSAFFAYHLRQVRGLQQGNFINSIDEIKSDADTLIMIDDFIGTGDTIIKFNDSLKETGIFQKKPDLKIYYLSLIMTEVGLENIRSFDPDIKMIYSELINKEYKVFSEGTHILPEYSDDERKIAKEVCRKIGDFLETELYDLGYKKSELLIGLHHNIPNNTLPIIWSNNKDWFPIFPRDKKNY